MKTPERMDEDSLVLTWEHADSVFNELCSGAYIKRIKEDNGDIESCLRLEIANFEEAFEQVRTDKSYEFDPKGYYAKNGDNEKIPMIRFSFLMVLHKLNQVLAYENYKA